ncbi:MAG: hypothetical protein ACRELB_10225 [Polyangiaceae bacterium]
MKLEVLWIVRDPNAQSELADVVFKANVRRLDHYMLGCPSGAWSGEQHTVFTERDEAVAEGIRRLVRVRPEREGWINEEAHRVFGYGAPEGRKR